MDEIINNILSSFFKKIQTANTKDDILNLEKEFLGKDSEIFGLYSRLKNLSIDEKKEYGQKINDVKNKIQKEIDDKKSDLEHKDDDFVDITFNKNYFQLQGQYNHLISMWKEIEEICIELGFSIEYGPNADTEHNVFEVLNIPSYHPARDMQDTIFLDKKGYVLTTHTSNMQNKILKKYKNNMPIKVICPGQVYRYEEADATHDWCFMQVEGVVVDKNIGIPHLNQFLLSFLKKIFKKDISTRIRPGYFPFVEPGLEIDISCIFCNQKGCKICKGTGWIECIPGGMIHPNVLKMGGIDPEIYTGFAFGGGIERLVNLKYGIKSIKSLRDINLKQYKYIEN